MASKKRRRALLACETCRRKKIRCDTGRPQCQNCASAHVECIYIESKRSLGQTKKSDINERLNRMEKVLNILASTVAPDTHIDSSASSSDSNDDLSDCSEEIATDTKDNVSTLHSHPVDLGTTDNIYTHSISSEIFAPSQFESIKKRINNPALTDSLSRLMNDIRKQYLVRAIRLAQYVDHPALPLDPSLCEYFIECYDRYNSEVMEILLPKQDFIRFCRRHCQAPPSHPYVPQTSSEIGEDLALFSLVGLLLLNQSDLIEHSVAKVQGERAMILALKMAQKVAIHIPSFSGLRGLLFFCRLCSMCHRFPLGTNYVCIAISSAVMIGFNRKESYVGLSPEAKLRRQLLWWNLYCQERSFALKLGVMPIVSDADISTELIDVEHDPLSDLGTMNHLISLCQIVGAVYKELYEQSAERKPIKRVFKDITNINKQLNEWQQKLPSIYKLDKDLRLNVGVTSSRARYAVGLPILHMHLVFHQLKIFLHTRLRSPQHNQPPKAPEPSLTPEKDSSDTAPTPSKSAKSRYRNLHVSLSLNSARCIVRLTVYASKFEPSLALSLICFTTSAVITVFLATLIRPEAYLRGAVADIKDCVAYVRHLEIMKDFNIAADIWGVLSDICHELLSTTNPNNTSPNFLVRPQTPTTVNDTPSKVGGVSGYSQPSYSYFPGQDSFQEGFFDGLRSQNGFENTVSPSENGQLSLGLPEFDEFDVITKQLIADSATQEFQFANNLLYMTSTMYDNV